MVVGKGMLPGAGFDPDMLALLCLLYFSFVKYQKCKSVELGDQLGLTHPDMLARQIASNLWPVHLPDHLIQDTA